MASHLEAKDGVASVEANHQILFISREILPI